MNKVILMGRLTRDCEIQETKANLSYTKFSIAVNRRLKRDGDPDADFFNCVAFGKTAEFIGKYFKKGSMISVVGHIQNGSYTDKDGNKRHTTDIMVDEVYFCGSKSDNTEKQEANNAEDDDLPF